MAAAAGKRESTSLSLFLEAQTWAEGVWIRKWHAEQKEAWREQRCEEDAFETGQNNLLEEVGSKTRV